MGLTQTVSSTAVTDGLVLLDEHRGTIYHLNHTGTVVLSALFDGGYEAAVTALCSRYAIAEDTARRDVTRLLDELCGRSLVVTS